MSRTHRRGARDCRPTGTPRRSASAITSGRVPALAGAGRGRRVQPGAPGADRDDMGICGGENLVGVRVAPVELSNQSKLVRAAHLWPSVYMQLFLRRRLPVQHAGSNILPLRRRRRAPILGEVGGAYTDRDRQWCDWAIDYIATRKIGIFWFALNPDSHDTAASPRTDAAAKRLGRGTQAAGASRLPSTTCSGCATPAAGRRTRASRATTRRRTAPPPR